MNPSEIIERDTERLVAHHSPPRRACAHVGRDGAALEAALAEALIATLAGRVDGDEARRAVSRYLRPREPARAVPDGPDDPCLRADAAAGWSAGREGESPLLGTTIAQLLGCREDRCAHPTPIARATAYLAGHDAGRAARRAASGVSLIVLRVADLERACGFYAALGLICVPQQHGQGPRHYACALGDTVLELYPSPAPVRGELRFGLRLGSAAVVSRLAVQSGARERPRLVRREPGADVYAVRDPDGNTLELEVPVA